jgi:hypothetical protein
MGANDARAKYNADELISKFNYRNAQTARYCRVRNLKTTRELLDSAVSYSFHYDQCDWLYSVYPLDNKKIREFLVFMDWAEGQMSHTGIYSPYPADHLYAFLVAAPKLLTAEEQLWVEALEQFSSYKGREARDFSFVGKAHNPNPQVWPYEMRATFWDPQRTVDNSYLSAVIGHRSIQELNRRIRVNGAVWIRTAPNNCLELYLPTQ